MTDKNEKNSQFIVIGEYIWLDTNSHSIILATYSNDTFKKYTTPLRP